MRHIEKYCSRKAGVGPSGLATVSWPKASINGNYVTMYFQIARESGGGTFFFLMQATLEVEQINGDETLAR